MTGNVSSVSSSARKVNHRRLLTSDVSNVFRHFGLTSGAPTSSRRNVDTIEDPEERRNLIDSLQSVDENDEGERYVNYDPTSHVNILFQLHGSVWPRVFPYCVFNTILYWAVLYVDAKVAADISVSATGHSLTALLLAFLVIQRSGIMYNRFMTARHALEDMNRICAEIVQIACIYSKHDQSEAAQNWRCRCAFTTILLLRTTMAALEYQSSQLNAWDILPDNDQDVFSEDIRSSFSKSSDAEFLKESLNAMDQDRTSHVVIQKRAHGKRSVFHRNFKAPSVLAYRLRDCILQSRDKVTPRMQILEELQVMNLINAYVVDFQKLKADISTPFPFPFVQMARTFLFVWVFSLPFVMARDVKNVVLASFLVFFATYGFIGVEFISVELADPYGDDPNDFDDVAFAHMTFEDIYISILRTDGIKRATMLRGAVKDLARRSVVKRANTLRSQRSVAKRSDASGPQHLVVVEDQCTDENTPLNTCDITDRLLAENQSILGIY